MNKICNITGRTRYIISQATDNEEYSRDKMQCLTVLKYLIHQNNIIHLENTAHLHMHLSNRSSNHKNSELKHVTIINENFRTSQKLIDELQRKLMSIDKTRTLSSYLPRCPFIHHSTLQKQHFLSFPPFAKPFLHVCPASYWWALSSCWRCLCCSHYLLFTSISKILASLDFIWKAAFFPYRNTC